MKEKNSPEVMVVDYLFCEERIKNVIAYFKIRKSSFFYVGRNIDN